VPPTQPGRLLSARPLNARSCRAPLPQLPQQRLRLIQRPLIRPGRAVAPGHDQRLVGALLVAPRVRHLQHDDCLQFDQVDASAARQRLVQVVFGLGLALVTASPGACLSGRSRSSGPASTRSRSPSTEDVEWGTIALLLPDPLQAQEVHPARRLARDERHAIRRDNAAQQPALPGKSGDHFAWRYLVLRVNIQTGDRAGIGSTVSTRSISCRCWRPGRWMAWLGQCIQPPRASGRRFRAQVGLLAALLSRARSG
jgi:hypothetical protein